MLRLGSAWYDVASQVKAVTEMGIDPAQLHPLHRRQPFRHAHQRGSYGPRGPPRHRARAEAGDGDPDGDAQHGGAFQARARDRLDLAGPLRGFPCRLRSVGMAIDEVFARGVEAGERRQAGDRHSALRLSGERQEHGQGRHAGRGGRFRHQGAARRQRGPRQGHRRDREPGADARAGGRPRRRGRAGRHGPPRRRLPDRGGRAPSRHRQGDQRLRLGLRLRQGLRHGLDGGA